MNAEQRTENELQHSLIINKIDQLYELFGVQGGFENHTPGLFWEKVDFLSDQSKAIFRNALWELLHNAIRYGALDIIKEEAMKLDKGGKGKIASLYDHLPQDKKITVSWSVNTNNESINLTVADNGRGFDVNRRREDEMYKHKNSVGLDSIETSFIPRMREVGFEMDLEVESVQGRGTKAALNVKRMTNDNLQTCNL